MRIMIIAMKFLPASGGSATYAHHLAEGLHRQGHSICLLAPSYKCRNHGLSFSYTVKRMPMTCESWYGLRIFIATIQILYHYIRFRPDVVWSSTYAGCRAIAPLCFLPGRWIGTIHGGGILRSVPTHTIFSRISGALGKLFIRRADSIVTVSREAEKLIRMAISESILESKLHVIYNGIDVQREKFVEKETALRQRPEWRKRKIILTVGRLVPAKGHDLALEAIAKLRHYIPEILYVIVGEGPSRGSLEAQIKNLQLENHVIITGYVNSEMLEYYYGVADVFVMAGRATQEFIEGFGLVFIEAGIRGKAVIGTRVGGISEAIRDKYNGLLIEPENSEALRDAMTELLQHPETALLYGKQGRDWVHNYFTMDVMAQHNDQLLRHILWGHKEVLPATSFA